MFKKSLSVALSALAAAVLVSACGGGGGSGGGGGGSYPDPGYNAWYDVYGYKCGTGAPSPGCNFYSNGLKIIDLEDPYFKSFYALDYDTWYYIDSYGRSSSYVGWAWQSPNGIIYDDWGDALNDETGKGRDFAADVANQEQNIIKSAGEHFAAKYELDAATGLKIAKVLNDWATIGKDRARTEADIADFTTRLYGVDFNKVKGALAEAMAGDKDAMNAVVDEAAANWMTSPETVKEVLKSWYGKQADQIL